MTIFTEGQMVAAFRQEVEEAGGAKAWLRKNKMTGEMSHALHIVSNGDAAVLPRFMQVRGYRQVIRYEKIG